MRNLGSQTGLADENVAAPAPPPKIVPKDQPLKQLIDEFVESRTAENTRLAYRKALDDFLSELGVDTLVGLPASLT